MHGGARDRSRVQPEPSRSKMTLAAGAATLGTESGVHRVARSTMAAGTSEASRTRTSWECDGMTESQSGTIIGVEPTATTSSTSTGASRGSAATPTALRACRPASPKISFSSPLAPLATSG